MTKIIRNEFVENEKSIMVSCDDRCKIIEITKENWDNEENVYYSIRFYLAGGCEKTFWDRIKYGLNIIFGRKSIIGDIYISQKEWKELIEVIYDIDTEVFTPALRASSGLRKIAKRMSGESDK